MNLAPIVLFTYLRPKHTKKLLDSLAQNEEAKDSIMYIYCDRVKNNNDSIARHKNLEVQEIIRRENRFKEVIIIVQKENKGLANSIISGVTEVINKHGKVIVLEDDLVVSKYFLNYMNQALEIYKNNNLVGQIGACNFFANGNKFPPFFFVPIPDCLGWATWQDRWAKFNSDAKELLIELRKNAKTLDRFNLFGSYNFENMLINQIEGKVNSWAIRWQAVCVLNEWLTLMPNYSMTNHIGSQDATHANFNVCPPLMKKKIELKVIDTYEDENVINAMKLGHSGIGDYYGNQKRISLKELVILEFKKKCPSFVKKQIRNLKIYASKNNP